MSDQRIDAVRAPIGFAGPGPAAGRLDRLRAAFAPLLGSMPVYVRNQGGEHFLTTRPDDTLFFPRSGPRSGEPRYRWEDQGDGLFYGFLKTDA